jgi:hypothetical protein
MLELIILAVLVFAVAWAWIHKERIESLDDFLELKWLLPSRRRKVDLEMYRAMRAERGVCAYRGQAVPWSGRVCRCEGYRFEKQRRGTAYCYCGDQYSVHWFKAPGSSETSSPE